MIPGLPDSENCMMLRLLVLTHYQRVTDRQTDRQTDTLPIPKSRSTIAERDKNGKPCKIRVTGRVTEKQLAEQFYRAMLCVARTMLSQDVCLSVCQSVSLSVCLSHAGILSKLLNTSSNFFLC